MRDAHQPILPGGAQRGTKFAWELNPYTPYVHYSIQATSCAWDSMYMGDLHANPVVLFNVLVRPALSQGMWGRLSSSNM